MVSPTSKLFKVLGGLLSLCFGAYAILKLSVSYNMQEEGASSLASDLQAQIDETLEEINPRCVLELLTLPLGDDYKTRRAEGLQGVRNILWAVGGGGATAISGGFTREDFMNEAFYHMTAAEQVINFSPLSKLNFCFLSLFC